MKKNDKAILDLFGMENPVEEWDNATDWKKEWKGMPEFINEDNSPLRSIIVHLETQEAIDEFEKLMKQSITEKTKYIYYPYKPVRVLKNKIYVDSEDLEELF